ncbi:hypothetical protein [Rhizobacter sp. OV335]|uniref:hypothetical protein n=1 Tax=Rhizobacter sp. OV335 TaxID=1500264 RepID=UPI0011614EBB|nr:hypothetical protein [Rhizobacter sp. OV335]
MKLRSSSIPPKLSSSQQPTRPTKAVPASPRRVVFGPNKGSAKKSISPRLTRASPRPLTSSREEETAHGTAATHQRQIPATERAWSLLRKTTQKSAPPGQPDPTPATATAGSGARSHESPRGRRRSSQPPLINPLYKKKKKASSADGNDRHGGVSQIGQLPARDHWLIPPLDDELDEMPLPADPRMTGVLGHIAMLEQRHLRHKDEKKKWRDQKEVLLAEIASQKEALKKLQEKSEETTQDLKETFS